MKLFLKQLLAKLKSLLQRIKARIRPAPAAVPAPEPDPVPNHTAEKVIFSIWLSMDGSIDTFTQWPIPGNEGQRDIVVKYAAMLFHLLSNGKFYPAIQESIAVAGVRDDMSGMGKLILGKLNELRDVKVKVEHEKDVVVDAESVFARSVAE